MKKCLLTVAMLLMVLPFSPFTEAQATNDTHLDINEKNIESYKEGTQAIENIKIGDKVSKIKHKYPSLMYSYTDDSNEKENYYEFDTKNGHMIITGTGKGQNESVKRITMIYDQLTDVDLNQLVDLLGEGTTKRVQDNKYTGGYAYVNNDKAHFQLSKAKPDSKNYKVYRIDLGEY